MTARRALWTLIAAATALRLVLAASLGAGHDEAYYEACADHPDWSYYDHPPMVALLIGLGRRVAGDGTLGLRLAFVGLAAGSTALVARLAARAFGPRAGVLAALAFSVSGYFGLAAGTFALPDGPLVFFWLLALDRLAAATSDPRGRPGPWVGVGLAWGGGLLSKYHAACLPAGALLYLLAEPGARRHLRRPGPYLAAAIGLLLFAPVVAWNARHGWASFAFQGSRALGGSIRPDRLAAAVGGQALYLFPWIWVGLWAALLRSREAGPMGRFLATQAVVPLAAFLAVACRREVLPHWSLVGLLPAVPLLGRSWARRWEAGPGRFRRRLAVAASVPVALAALAVAQARTGRALPIPPTVDPTADLFGWDQVAEALRARGLGGPAGPFVFASHWSVSGQLRRALRGEAPVLCYSPRDAHAFAAWSRPADWLGRDGWLVVVDPCSTEPGMYDRYFARIDPAGDVGVVRGGSVVRRVRLYRCVRQVRPFPFGGVAGSARMGRG